MNSAAWQALLPLLLLSGGSVLLLIEMSLARRQNVAIVIALLTLVAAAIGQLVAWPAVPVEITPLLIADRYGALFSMLFILAGLAVMLMSLRDLHHYEGDKDEYLLLLLLALMGAVVLCYSRHLASLLLGMELLGISLYTLIAYPDKSWLPLEAGVKYLVLSGAASAILLFGFALMYASLGQLMFADVGQALRGSAGGLLLLVSAVMILSGLAFKLSLVPYHMWTPDVYEGSPIPVTGFLATISKGAIFVALLRWYLDAQLFLHPAMLDCLALLAILSMLVGNLLALRQANVKRVLAYSSIAHMGYLVLALVVCGFLADPQLGMEAAAYYLLAYVVTTLAAFAALAQLPASAEERGNCELDKLRGLFWREPMLAFLLTTALLSLAGIPLTVGFVGKFYLVAAGVSAQLWPLLAALVLGSAIGIYYYLRIVYTMTLGNDALTAGDDERLRLRGLTIMLILAVLVLGVYPQPLISYLGQAF